jgi:[acyl-carrier-protein] S-malonyltransferase
MGRDIFNSFAQAKIFFEVAQEIYSPSLLQIIFEGPSEGLSKTVNAQPSVYLVSYALFQILKENGVNPDFVAGHSLGEYTALAAAEVFSFEDGLKLIKERARLMSKITQKVDGGMLAVVGLSFEKVREISEKAQVEIANFNTPKQFVLSGEKGALQKARDLVKSSGGRAVELNVEGPFHSSYMKEIALDFKSVVEKVNFNPPKIPVIMNVVAEEVKTPERIKELLVSQIFSSVKWTETLFYLSEKSVNVFFDVGPGRVMEGLVKKTLDSAEVVNVEDELTLKNTLLKWGGLSET